MSEHPIIQISTSLRGEGQVVARVSSVDDLATADEILDAMNAVILGKMNALASSLKEEPQAVQMIQEAFNAVPIAPSAFPTPQAQATTQAFPAPSNGGPCSLGTKGTHAMACRSCAGPIGPRKQMGQFMGHSCLTNPKDNRTNPDGCGATWCN